MLHVWIIYIPTLGKKWPHSQGNVGKYSLHGASGSLSLLGGKQKAKGTREGALRQRHRRVNFHGY